MSDRGPVRVSVGVHACDFYMLMHVYRCEWVGSAVKPASVIAEVSDRGPVRVNVGVHACDFYL